MPVIKIKASVEKKDDKLKNVRDIIRTLKLVYAEEQLLISFKGKFQDWTHKVVKEWRSCNAEKSDEFLSSTIFRVLSTTFILVCFLEFLRGCLTDVPNVFYLMLPFVYYLSIALMNLASAVLITQLRSPSRFSYQIYEYFEMVLFMHKLLNRRINYVQRRMNLNGVGQNNLPPDIYAFEQNSGIKLSYSLFSFYSLYGVYLALCIFIQLSYFHYESFTVLKYLTFNLLLIVGSSKVFAILKFIGRTIKKRKNVQALTGEFKTWFDDECELKRILQESRENTKIFSAFSPQSSKTFPADEYLNFLFFAVTCQGIFCSNFTDRDLEKAVLTLLYEQVDFPKDDSRSNEFIQITTSCNEQIKSIKFLDENEVTVEDEKIPKNETKKKGKPEDNKKVGENIPTENNKVVPVKTGENKNKKSKIPRRDYSKKLTSLSSDAKKPLAPTSNSPGEATFQPSHDGNFGNLNDSPDKENLDPDNHFNSRRDEKIDEGIPVTPSILASNSNTDVTLELPLDDEHSVYQKSPSTAVNVELANHSKSSRKRKNNEVDVIGTPEPPFQDQLSNLRDQNDIYTEQKTYSVNDSNPRHEEKEVDNIGTPEPSLIFDTNAVTNTTLQAPVQDETLKDQNDLPAEENSQPDIHHNSDNEENEVDNIGTPEPSLISDTNAVKKTTLQAPVQDETLRDQNDLPAKQNSQPEIHPNSGNEKKEVDNIGTPEPSLISDTNAVKKTTLQAPVQDETLRDQNSQPDIHPKSGNEEKEVDNIGTPEPSLISDTSAVTNTTLQAPVQDETLKNQNDLPDEENSQPDIHHNSGNGENNAEVDCNETPEISLISDTNAVKKTTLQAPVQDETLRDQNELPAEPNSYPEIHHNSGNDEKNAEVDFNETPEPSLISDTNAVKKTTLQAPVQDETLKDQNDLPAEQHSHPDIHPNSGNGENNADVSFIATPETPPISDTNAIMNQDEHLNDQNDLSAAQNSYPDSYMHPNSGNEENNYELGFNLIPANEESDIIADLILAVDTTRKCYKMIRKIDFIRVMDLNTKTKELCIKSNENIQSHIHSYNENENRPIAQNSGTISNKTEPNSNSVIDSMDDTKFGVEVSNVDLDQSSGEEVKCVSNPLFENEENVIHGYNDDIGFNIHEPSDPNSGRVECLGEGNEENKPSLKESEKMGTSLRNEISSESLKVTRNDESSPKDEEFQSCNSIDNGENQTDNLERPEKGIGDHLSLNNFSRAEEELSTNQRIHEEMEESLEPIPNGDFYLNGHSMSNTLSDSQKTVVDNFISAFNKCMSNEEQAEEELTTVQGIYSSIQSETIEKLLECFSNQNSDQNMNGQLNLNFLSHDEKITFYNLLLEYQKYLSKSVVESLNYLESSPKKDEDDDLSESFSKLNIQSGDVTSIASNENIPQRTSSSTQTESAPKIKSSEFVDLEQNINENCFEQNTPNNDVEQHELAYDSQKSFLTRNGKELIKNSSSSPVLIKIGENHNMDANNRNNESKGNLPHFESAINPMENDATRDGTICLASCGNSEINKQKDKRSENTEMLVEDGLNRNESDPKLQKENSRLSNNGKTSEASDEIKAKTETTSSTILEHKPADEVTENVTHFSANNSTLHKSRKILKVKRRAGKVSKNKQVNKTEAYVTSGELEESENVNRDEALKIGTGSSKVGTAKLETTTSIWENLTNLPWGNSINLKDQNETTQECGQPEEIISQVQNESETKTSVNSENINGMERISSENVESMKNSAHGDDSKVTLDIRDFEGNDPYKSFAFPPVVYTSNPCKPKEIISFFQNEVDTNMSLSESSQEDPRNNGESTQMNDDLPSAMQMKSQVSIPPIKDEKQKNTTEEKTCQEQTVVDSKKGESIRKDQSNGERGKSRYSHADELQESSRDLPYVRSVNENCDNTESSSDLNREACMSLNERKIMVADYSQKCTELEENNVFGNSSLDVRTHSHEKMFQDIICEPYETFTDGGKKNICNAIGPLTDSQNYNKKSPRKGNGQSKAKRTSDSAATNDETGKQNFNSEDCCGKKRNEEVTRKKDKRYVCLQKYRGIVVEEDSTTERCEIERLERQASYVSSCEKLSVTQEKTSLRLLDKRNGHSENTRKASFNQYSANIGSDLETKNKEIKEWISSISSPESSLTFSERPPTGSSEDPTFRFHGSTSVSNSNATKNTKIFSGSSVNPPIYPSLPEEEQSNHDKEISELKSKSNAFNEFEKGGMKWQSNLDCRSSGNISREHKQANDCRSANDCLDIEKESTPVNYHLKCGNLDIRFLDSEPNLTLRFVKEDHDGSQLLPTTRKLIIHSDNRDEILLPTDTSSLHDGHASPTHPFEIPEIRDTGNTVRMSAEPLSTGLRGNLDHPNAPIAHKVFSFDNPLDKHSQQHDELAILGAEKSCNHPLSENERLKLSTPNQTPADILSPEDGKFQEISPIASTRNDPKITPDANVYAVDTKLIDYEKPEDFIFESEAMKIDYKPYSDSESISISYRRQRNYSKLTFKSPEKKLYLKTSTSRVETDLDRNMVDDVW